MKWDKLSGTHRNGKLWQTFRDGDSISVRYMYCMSCGCGVCIVLVCVHCVRYVCIYHMCVWIMGCMCVRAQYVHCIGVCALCVHSVRAMCVLCEYVRSMCDMCIQCIKVSTFIILRNFKYILCTWNSNCKTDIIWNCNFVVLTFNLKLKILILVLYPQFHVIHKIPITI